MKTCTSIKTALYTFIFSTIALSSACADRIAEPNGIFYYQPAASVFGGEAAWINPAALGRFYASGSQAMADYYDGKFIKSWGLAAQGDRFATAYRHLDNPAGTDFSEFLAGGGFSVGSDMSLGLSYRYYSNGPDYFHKLHTWNVGMQSGGDGPYRFGFVAGNLNRARRDGERTEVELRYSVAYRPLDDRFTLAADILTSTHTKWRNAEVVYHAEYTPYPGLFVNAFIDSHKNFQFGLRANLLKYFVGSRSTFNRSGDGRGTTVFVGQTNMRQKSILKEPQIRLTAQLPADVSENPPQPVFGRRSLPYTVLLSGLYRAAEDPAVKEVVIDVCGSSLGFGQAQEFRDAVLYLKENGKHVTCYLQSQSNKAYYMASAADRIVLPPVCQLNLVGLRSELTFYGGTLEKIGVKLDMVRIGDFKSATEAYTSTQSSELNRQEVNNLLDDVYDQFVEGIADGRRLPPDSVKALIDRGPFTSQEAIDCGLVDDLVYRDLLFEKGLPLRRTVSFSSYLADTLINNAWSPRPVLAVMVADGEIKGDPGSPTDNDGVTPAPFQKAFEAVRRDPGVRGVLFRVNSPGGFALAADDIYHFASRAREVKPVVISMASIAASGGYELSMTGRRIFALPATITGSIGIFGGKADFSEFYRKINLGKELYTRGKFAGLLTTTRPFTPQERAKYYSQLAAFYDHFVTLVAENRSLSKDSVDALGQGRVWTGRAALKHGLIDELGGFRQAIAYTADAAGVKDYTLVTYPKKRPLFLFPGLKLWRFASRVLAGGRASDQTFRDAAGIPDDGIYSRMPFDLAID